MSEKPQISYQQELLRKTIHLSSLWMVAALLVGNKLFCIVLFGVLFVICTLCEYGYSRKIPFIYQLYRKLFGKMLRPESDEKKSKIIVSGGPYVLLSALLCAILFPTPIAAFGMALMLLGDTGAALIGRKFGKIKIFGSKSLEGSLSFVCIGLILCFVWQYFYNWSYIVFIGGFLGTVAACIAEIFEKPIHIDDNFSIPVFSGAILYFSTFI